MEMNFLEEEAVVVGVGELVREHLKKGQLPFMVLFVNPADVMDINIHTINNPDPLWITHVLRGLISQIENPIE